MKRHKAFDPPEYHDWTLAPGLLDEYEATLARDPARAALVAGLDLDTLLSLYRGLVRARLHDTSLKRWVKNGVITKAWLATGEEAVTVGATLALDRRGGEGDVVGPMIRNAAACAEMGMPLWEMFGAYLAIEDTTCRGRDLHIGDLKHGVIAPVSHVGSLLPVMVGAALAFQLQDEPRVAMTWVGDGATKTGEFHEGANLAAAAGLPIVIFIQNNQVALGTRTEWHHKGDFLAFGPAYGMPSAQVDGNNVLDVYAASRLAAERARAGQGPTLLVAETFRMGGHATHDEREAREILPPELFARWGQRDPLGLYEEWLLRRPYDLSGEGHTSDLETHNRAFLAQLEQEVSDEVEAAAERALAVRATSQPDPAKLLDGLYA